MNSHGDTLHAASIRSTRNAHWLWSRTPAVPAAALAVAALTTMVLAGSASAEPRTHVLRQVTNITTGTIWAPKMRSMDAGSVAFTAAADVMGPGTDHTNRELYYFDEATDLITRVTTTPSGESYDPARQTDSVFAFGRPDVVTFVSTGDFDPDVDNSDGNPEIFFWEVESGIFHQVTDTGPTIVNGEPYLSDSGRCLVFTSTDDLDNNDGSDSLAPGTQYVNVDGSQEVFLYSQLDAGPDYPHTGNYTQISNGPPGTTSGHPTIGGYWFARQCQTTAYQSDWDQTGHGVPGQHIYIWKRPKGGPSEIMSARLEIPLGIQPGHYQRPNISSASPFARGPFVVFETDADLWRNLTVGNNMFRFRVFHPRMTQYTQVTTGEIRRPVVSDGGGVIVFESTDEHLNQNRPARFGGDPPFNPDGNFEIVRTKGRRKAWQITRTENCENTQSSIRDQGRAIAFISTCDLIPGHNPNGLPQLFIWHLAKKNDPLIKPGGCLEADACCNSLEGSCYERTGRKGTPRPPRPNCVDTNSGCNN